MKNRYRIYPDIHFGITKLSPGVKSFDEVLKFAEEFRKDTDFQKVHYQLTDMRGCLFDFTSETDRIEEMKALMEKYESIDNQKMGVYLVDQPMETAYVSLFFHSIEYDREICSTIEKAYNLLPVRVGFEDFKKMIDF